MRVDDVIDLRRLWATFNYAPQLPAATILAERDWIAYVSAMAEAVPAETDLAFPDETEIAWSWPDGVAIVLSEPVEIRHAIVSKDDPSRLGRLVPVPAHYESQTCRGIAVGPLSSVLTRAADGEAKPGIIEAPKTIIAHPIYWIGEDPADLITGHWIPSALMHPSATGAISQSSRLLLSVVTALGHRLTRLDPPATASRPERRRVERELPGLRVLQLATGASVSRAETTGTVEWSRRWMVRGHWRIQPHGPRRSLRKVVWIDPYVKGPEDKPLDVRPTVWTTGGPPRAES